MSTVHAAKRRRPEKQNADHTPGPERTDHSLRYVLKIRISDAQRQRAAQMRRAKVSIADHVRAVLEYREGELPALPRGRSLDYRAALVAFARVETLLAALLQHARRAQTRGEPLDLDALVEGVNDMRALAHDLLHVPAEDETETADLAP